jgi:iron(III)-enterobactin esterase
LPNSDYSLKNSPFNKIWSHWLQRYATFELIKTAGSGDPCLLLLNDGQDHSRLELEEKLNSLHRENLIPPVHLVAIHAFERLHEYGVSNEPDYMDRGNRASQYSCFVINELLPYVGALTGMRYTSAQTAFAGFSLGGLSALDITWNHPSFISTAGIFSGSLWWRRKALDEGYTDRDRIIHDVIRNSAVAKNFRCWLMAGSEDETADRNRDGVIDSVEDTLDLADILQDKGLRNGIDLTFEIVPGASHNHDSWNLSMEHFLLFAFGKNSRNH